MVVRGGSNKISAHRRCLEEGSTNGRMEERLEVREEGIWNGPIFLKNLPTKELPSTGHFCTRDNSPYHNAKTRESDEISGGKQIVPFPYRIPRRKKQCFSITLLFIVSFFEFLRFPHTKGYSAQLSANCFRFSPSISRLIPPFEDPRPPLPQSRSNSDRFLRFAGSIDCSTTEGINLLAAV